MCRWVLYFGASEVRLSDVILDPEHSLFSQSRRAQWAPERFVHLGEITAVANFLARNHGQNMDGHGVTYVVEDKDYPGLYLIGQFRSIQPLFNSESLKSLSRTIWSRRFMAHIRATSGSAISEVNTHPFVFSASGASAGSPISFMHNGSVAHFQNLRREMHQELSEAAFFQIRGTTDSETLGAMCWEFLFSKYGNACYTGAQLAEALLHCVGKVLSFVDRMALQRGWRNVSSSLNMAICSPRAVAACRFRNSPTDPPSLFFQTGCGVGTSEKKPSTRKLVSSASFRLHDVQCASSLDAVTHLLVASEPFLNKGTWQSVPRNSVLFFDEESSNVELFDIDVPRFGIRQRVRDVCERVRRKFRK